MYNTLLRGDKKGRKLAPKSIRNLHGVVHSMLAQAQKLGYLAKGNPADGVTLPRVEKREMNAIMDDKLDEFLSAIKGHQFESVYLVDVFTGMRQGEILGLSWADINYDKGTIQVRKQKERKKGGVYKRVSVKNDRVRTIRPAQYVMDVLKAEQRKQKERKLRAGNMWSNNMNLVFTNESGRHLAAVTVYNNFKAVVKGIGMDDVRFHDLRHTFALISLQSGVDIKTLQAMLTAASNAVQRHINEWKARQ